MDTISAFEKDGVLLDPKPSLLVGETGLLSGSINHSFSTFLADVSSTFCSVSAPRELMYSESVVPST